MNKTSTFDTYIKKKILDLSLLKEISQNLKSKKKKIIHCHGTFDLIHAGHYRHFQDSKNLGDILFVTITGDKFVNKGPNRPVFNEFLRAEMIASLSYVDYVSVVQDQTAVPSIKIIKPDIYVKGIDYKDKKQDLSKNIFVEENEVKKNGGVLRFTDNISFSSSSLINENFSLKNKKLSKILNDYKEKGMNHFMSLIKKIKNKRILLIGDTIIDKYVYTNTLGKPAKESILSVLRKDEKIFAGGVIAAANNISDFCKNVILITGIGKKSHQDLAFIKNSISKNIKLNVIGLKDRPTTKKTRFIDSSYMKKMFEVYDMVDNPLNKIEENSILNKIKKNISKVDVVIVTDFGHGLINKKIIDFLSKSKVFLAVNAQTNSANKGFNLITKYPKADYICIDEPEFRLAVQEKKLPIKELFSKKVNLPKTNLFIVTAGKEGCFVKTKNSFLEIPAFTDTVVDTIGAGDVFFVLSALFASIKASSFDVGFLGNVSGAIKVNIHGHSSFIKKLQFLKFIESVIK